MSSEFEVKFHRSFLDLKLALAIWNEDYNYQNQRGGPPDRQKRRETDPVYDYHVRQGPHYPSKPPGTGSDEKYDAVLARADGTFDAITITTKRGLTGQKFIMESTFWELSNSVMCSARGQFIPIVNPMMEVTGHYAKIWDKQLLRPEGVEINNPAECIAQGVPLYLWIWEYHYGKNMRDNLQPPEGWVGFKGWHGGIHVVTLPNGEVIGAVGKEFASNNGTTYSVMSPLDFWAPGSRLLAAGLRGLTSKLSAAAVKGLRMLSAPTKELALLSAARLAKTLPGVAVPTRAIVPFEHFGRRTLIMGEDVATFRAALAQSQSQPGFYDIMIHGDTRGFSILEKVGGRETWRQVSVSEVAAIVRPKLAAGDKIRLLACEVGQKGGPAQQLANELGREVWAPSTVLDAVPKAGVARQAFVPENGGKFFQFMPHRGAALPAGGGAKVTSNYVKGTIRNAR